MGPTYAAPVGAVLAALATGATLWGRVKGGVNVAWVTTWDLRLTFPLEGLAARLGPPTPR